MERTDYNISERTPAKEQSFTDVFPAYTTLIKKVYLWMAMALAITGMTAYVVATSDTLLQLVFRNSLIFWGLLIGELAMVIALTMAINRLSLTTATVMFIIYSVINGATMAVIFLAYAQESVTSVFFITAGTFAAMSVWGYVTDTDLTTMGKLCYMALIGLIIATIVNMFLQNGTMSYVISYIGVIIFVGLTAYDTQKIKMMLIEAEDDSEDWQKVALLGALSLYLDFVNLFLYLLRIFGKRR